MMRTRRPLTTIAFLLAAQTVAAVSLTCARADRLTYIDETGETVTAEARLAGSGQGAHALELPDGQILLIPQAALVKREPAPDPEPSAPEEVVAALEEKFSPELFRAHVDKPYVVGLILSDPLLKEDESRVRGFLRKAADFMNRVQGVFLRFARRAGLPTAPVKYPLVVLIFESNEDFEKYVNETIGDRGLSAGNLSGFYSGITNYLTVRMSECHTYELPLHEAIHQQVYNRGVFQRLAPIPSWFNEGIATGFAGTGARINSGPYNIHPRYAKMAQEAKRVDWSDVVADDKAFRGDVLAGEAYANAWSLHWMLVTKYKNAYSSYVRMLSEKSTLQDSAAKDRVKEFETAFGASIGDLQQQFPLALRAALRRQKMRRPKDRPPGVSLTESNFGEVRLIAVKRRDQNGLVHVKGKLRNMSPIRSLSFHVTVETNTGTYAEWHVPDLSCRESAVLNEQFVQKLMKNGRGGPSETFRVMVRSVAATGEEANRWKQGDLPVPVFGE